MTRKRSSSRNKISGDLGEAVEEARRNGADEDAVLDLASREAEELAVAAEEWAREEDPPGK